MLYMQNCSAEALICTSQATTGTATAYVDMLGYDEVKIVALLNSAGATSSNPGVLKLSESADTYYSNSTNITGMVGDATDGFTIAAADTANPQVAEFNVDCRARNRYLFVAIGPAGATQIVGAVAVKSRAESSTAAAAVADMSVSG